MTLDEMMNNLGTIAASEEQFLINCVRDKQIQIKWFRDARDAELEHTAKTFNSYMEVLETELANLTRHATALGVRFEPLPEEVTAGVK